MHNEVDIVDHLIKGLYPLNISLCFVKILVALVLSLETLFVHFFYFDVIYFMLIVGNTSHVRQDLTSIK